MVVISYQIVPTDSMKSPPKVRTVSKAASHVSGAARFYIWFKCKVSIHSMKIIYNGSVLFFYFDITVWVELSWLSESRVH